MAEREPDPGGETFFDGCPLMALIAGADGRIERVNALLCEGLGRSREELEGKALLELLDPADREGMAAALAALAAPGSHGSFAGRAPLGDGGEGWLRFHCRRSPDGASVLALVMDITRWKIADDERRRTEQQLERSQMLLRTVLDNVPAILWAADPEGVCTLSDGLGLRTLGIAPGQLVGQHVADFYNQAPVMLDALRRALAGEAFVVANEGGGVSWESRFMPMRDGGGAVREVVVLSFDVTDRARAERRLRQQLEVIEAQRVALRSMEMPIVEVWDGVLALPVIGAMDAARAAQMMEGLLAAVVRTGASHAIVDLTGTDAVDATSAEHLLKVVQALTLVGARVVVSGIRPSIAGVLVSLGADLSRVATVRDLREAIRRCMEA